MNRGTARQFIYEDNDHRYEFLALLKDITVRYQIEIHAYCLMGNHYHLLLKTPLPNLAQAMRHLDGVYTQRFNRSKGRDGPLFRGRYRACLIEADNYLVEVSRYIHLNPVAAKINKKAEDYIWSSYKYYIGLELPPTWLTLADILKSFGTENQSKKYCLFVEAKKRNREEIDQSNQKFKTAILGSDSFIKEITNHFFQKQHQIPEISLHKTLPLFPNIEEIKSSVMNFFSIN